MDIVLFSTADWDNPFWTNKQHVAVELANLGYRVLYIDSIGLRQPTLKQSDFKRIFKRVLKVFNLPKKVHNNIWVLSPLALPFYKYTLIRKINKLLLNCMVYLCKKYLHFSNDIFWTYSPLTTSLLNFSYYSHTLYHCVDEIKEQPGMPKKIIDDKEKELLEKIDIVFTTSQKLFDTKKKYTKNIHLHSNVADFNHFNKATQTNSIIPKELLEISSPILMFIGAISSYKIDFELLTYIAKQRPNYSIVLIGKVGEGDPYTNISTLKEYKNIYFLGPKKYTQLPFFLKGAQVALLPNTINNYTSSMFPMKFFEYLSAGKQIVSTDLPALKDYNNLCFLSKNYDDFIKNIDKICTNKIDNDLVDRLAYAKKNSYTKRTLDMLKLANIPTLYDN